MGWLPVVLCLPLTAGAAVGERVFDAPSVGGVRVDWCFAEARQCGQPAANAFCRSQGFGEASAFRRAPGVRPTRILGTGATCNGRCDGFETIWCVGEAAVVGPKVVLAPGARVPAPVLSVWNGVGRDGSEFPMRFGDEATIDWKRDLLDWPFEWRAPAGTRTATWQVATLSPPGGSDWRRLPGEVAEGPVSTLPAGPGTARFSIDFSRFAPAPPPDAPAASAGPVAAAPAVAAAGVSPQRPRRFSLPAATRRADVGATALQGRFRRTYYVRVVALDAAGRLLGQPSSPVRVVYGTAAPPSVSIGGAAPASPTARKASLRIRAYSPVRLASLDAHKHWIVTADVPGPGHTVLYRKGQKLYWDPDAPRDRDVVEQVIGAFESLVDFFVSAVNWVAHAYQDIKAALVSIVPGCDGTCREILSAGLDLALASMGIPPSLPDFDQLVDLSKGYVAEYLAAEAARAGAPVPEEVARALVDELVDRAREVAEHGPDGKQWLRPDPDYGFRPVLVELQLHNETDTPLSGTLTISPAAIRPGTADWIWLYGARALPVPRLGPGETLVIPVTLEKELRSVQDRWLREHDGSYDNQGIEGEWGRYFTEGTLRLGVGFSVAGRTEAAASLDLVPGEAYRRQALDLFRQLQPR